MIIDINNSVMKLNNIFKKIFNNIFVMLKDLIKIVNRMNIILLQMAKWDILIKFLILIVLVQLWEIVSSNLLKLQMIFLCHLLH